MDDEQKIWELAVIKCGLWKPEPCLIPKWNLEHWSTEGQRIAKSREFSCDCRWVHHKDAEFEHDIPAPPLNDPASAFAMLLWLFEHEGGLRIWAPNNYPKIKHGFRVAPFSTPDGPWMGDPVTIYSAISRAVLATQEAA